MTILEFWGSCIYIWGYLNRRALLVICISYNFLGSLYMYILNLYLLYIRFLVLGYCYSFVSLVLYWFTYLLRSYLGTVNVNIWFNAKNMIMGTTWIYLLILIMLAFYSYDNWISSFICVFLIMFIYWVCSNYIHYLVVLRGIYLYAFKIVFYLISHNLKWQLGRL